MNTLRILQYNVQKSKNGVLILLLEGRHESYDIIAVQELWLNPQVKTTYCLNSCPYTLVFPQQGRACTSIYINKQIPLSQWHSSATPDYSWVKLELDSGPITIHNIYSETPNSYESTEWNTPIPEMLEAVQNPGRHLVVGDFNLHHTLWGGQNVRRQHARATQLIEAIRTSQLDLLLQPGTITREKHNNEPSTLDLALSTPDLTAWITSCKVTNDHRGSDHKPIVTTIQISSLLCTTQEPKRNFKKANLEAIKASAK
jgi:exonuclease III